MEIPYYPQLVRDKIVSSINEALVLSLLEMGFEYSPDGISIPLYKFALGRVPPLMQHLAFTRKKLDKCLYSLCKTYYDNEELPASGDIFEGKYYAILYDREWKTVPAKFIRNHKLLNVVLEGYILPKNINHQQN